MDPISVLIIDDSAFIRKTVSDIVAGNNRINVVGTARNGKVALNKLENLLPDVIFLDVVMPEMDGITTIKRIMSKSPVSVIMISSITKDIRDKTVQTITNGAVDFIAKPSNISLKNQEKLNEEWSQKIYTAANVSVPASYTALTKQIGNHVNKHDLPHVNTVLAIGTSTGGPRALERVLVDLPVHFPVPIFIVQHMPAKFTESLAGRLDQLVRQKVKEAIDGETIQPYTVYIAPGDFHMELEQIDGSFVIELSKEEAILGHRPSVDVLFHSLARHSNINKIAVVMTGMGKDGAKGILQLKQSDSNTIVIAESAESAIVYGMPKSAVQTNQVDHVSHLHQLGELITRIVH